MNYIIQSNDILKIIYDYKSGFEDCELLFKIQKRYLWIWEVEILPIMERLEILERDINQWLFPTNLDHETLTRYLRKAKKAFKYFENHLKNAKNIMGTHFRVVPDKLFYRLLEITDVIKTLHWRCFH